MVLILINLIQLLSWVIYIALLANMILSFFLPPYHQVRVFLDRITEPLLGPIRKVIHPMQGIDFSPLILLIIVQVVESALIQILARFI